MPKGGSVQKKIRDLERSLRKKVTLLNSNDSSCNCYPIMIRISCSFFVVICFFQSPDDPATAKLTQMIANLKQEVGLSTNITYVLCVVMTNKSILTGGM